MGGLDDGQRRMEEDEEDQRELWQLKNWGRHFDFLKNNTATAEVMGYRCKARDCR